MILGDRFQEEEALGADTNSTTTPKTTLTITLPSDTPAGTYRIGCSYTWKYSIDSGAFYFRARIRVDDSTVVFEQNECAPMTSASFSRPVCPFAYVELTAGTHHIDLDFWTSANSYVATVAYRRLDVCRVSDSIYLQNAVDLSAQSTSSDTFVQSLRISMPAETPAGWYCIGWSYTRTMSQGAPYSFQSRVQVDDVAEKLVANFRYGQTYLSTTMKYVDTGFGVIYLAEGAHTIDLDFASATGATAYIQQRRLEVWKIPEEGRQGITLENLAFWEGAGHIFSFTESTAYWATSGFRYWYSGAAPDLYSYLTGSNVTRDDPTVAGCRGRLLFTSVSSKATLSCASISHLLRYGTSSITWEMVFTPRTTTEGYFFWGPNADWSFGFCSLKILSGVLSCCRPSTSYLTLTGMTPTNIADTLCYVAISWNHAISKFQGYWKYAGGDLQSGVGSAGLSAATGAVNVYLGDASTAQQQEVHHWAVYPSILTEAQVLTRLSIIGL